MILEEGFLCYSLKLKKANIINYELETRLIFKNILNISDATFIVNPKMLINNNQQKKLENIFKKRVKQVPLAYLLNEQFFWKHNFYVNENVLIPRADSETLIVAFKEYFKKEEKLSILEIGVGSGCLCLSILNEYQNAKALGVDISQNALKVCQMNAENMNLLDRIKLQQSNIFENVKEKFDVIISNPPYIAEDDVEVQDSVKKFEPSMALFATNNGLFFYQEILKNANNFLNNKGMIFFEIGYNQRQEVCNLATENNYKYVETKKDLSNKDRVIILKK